MKAVKVIVICTSDSVQHEELYDEQYSVPRVRSRIGVRIRHIWTFRLRAQFGNSSKMEALWLHRRFSEVGIE